MTSLSTWRRFTLVALVAMFAAALATPPALHAQAAQAATLTGLVKSDLGQPLEGANVFITELTISVQTNAQGRYTITIPAERVRNQSVVLRARSISYLSKA